MESNTLIGLQTGIQALHYFSQQVAALFKRCLVEFALRWVGFGGQLVERVDGDIFDEVFVHGHRGAIPSILEALVKLGQEIFLYVDMGPTLRELLTDFKNCIAPKRSLKQRVLVANQIENQGSKLAELPLNDFLWHLTDKHGHKLKTSSTDTTSVFV